MDPPSLASLSLTSGERNSSGAQSQSTSTAPSDILGLETGVWAALSVRDATWETHSLFRHAHPLLPSEQPSSSSAQSGDAAPETADSNVVTSNVPANRLAPYLSPDVQMLYPGGLLLRGTNAVRDTLGEAQPWSKFVIQDPQVIFLGTGDDEQESSEGVERRLSAKAAVITYAVKARTEEQLYEALCSSTWAVDSRGKWVLHTHQQTAIRE